MRCSTRMKTRRKRRSRYHRGVHTSPKLVNECHFRSGWEQKYLEHLDNDEQVKSYAYEALKIEYVSNRRTHKVRKYIPDVFVHYTDGHDELVEIKPSKRVHNAKNTKKLLAACDWCAAHGVTFKVVTEIELKQLGVL